MTAESPTTKGKFGPYGGQFVPETLMPALKELEEAREATQKKRITIKTKHDKDTSGALKHKVYVARILTALKELDLEEAVKNSKKIE